MKRTTFEDPKRFIPRSERRPAAIQRGGGPGGPLVTCAASIVLVVGMCCACARGEMVTRRWGTPPASSSGSVRRPKPTGYAPRTDAAPKIDGGLEDPCWAKAPAMVLDRTLDGNVKAAVRTEVRAVRDDTCLYVAFRCAEPSAEALRAQRRGHDGEIWSDDSVEMFIGSGSSYHHFGVNAVGSTYDGWRKDRSWNSGLTAAAARGKDEWTAELAIPLAKLTDAGKAERWIANFNRNRHAGGSWQEFAWSPTLSGDSHAPARFGTLVFGSAPPKQPGAGDDAAVRFLPAAEAEGIVQFDLSDPPAGTKVYRADLLVFRKQPLTGFDDEAMTDIAIYPIFRPVAAGEKIAPKAKPLALRGPWYDRFDATEAVRQRLAGPGAAGAEPQAENLAFLIKACPFVNLEATCLDVAYEGRPGRVPAQVTGVKAIHRAGQTFITWREIDDPAGSDEITWGRLRDILAKIDRERRLRYCVYRSDRPITAKNLHEASLIARVRPLSCWNVNGRSVDKPIDHALGNQYVLDWHQWNPFQAANVEGEYGTDCLMERLVIQDGPDLSGLPRGTGLYVHTIGESGEGGRGYYAVVTCVDGVENTAEITAENATPAVEEIPGIGEPVLQKVFPPKPYFNYREKRLHYVRWVGGPQPQSASASASGPPYGNLPSQYYNWGVGVPELHGTGAPGRQATQPAAAGTGSGPAIPMDRDSAVTSGWPVELSLHRDGRSYYRTQLRVEKDSLVLSPHDFPIKTWWYGYHEALGTLKSFRQGRVHPYTERRLLAFIEWAASKWPIDRSRILVVGAGGGAAGSGALHLGIRHPDVFNLCLSGYGMADYAGEIRALTKVKRAGTFPREVQSIWGQVQWNLQAPPARAGEAGQTARSVWEELDLTRRVRELPPGTGLPLATAHCQSRDLAEKLNAAYVDFDCELLAVLAADGWEKHLGLERHGAVYPGRRTAEKWLAEVTTRIRPDKALVIGNVNLAVRYEIDVARALYDASEQGLCILAAGGRIQGQTLLIHGTLPQTGASSPLYEVVPTADDPSPPSAVSIQDRLL